ncbi:DNA helicase RecQ [Rhodospirillaceae bacterium KN72]|uniref:DNA helicase RecQ n=1 Tax=Pacificispira spongiicola TaxID=2729598 RepID=A0A7Y0HD65_9PROT|nr:DNA helicase RecQ [Pacificispira spongiicola]NMM43476.1 DNA helicase RecQ [Pacificispira spongiicola]
MSDPEDIVKSVFGFAGFRPGQREIVDRLLGGVNTLTVMPTGAGKSLCYQVPALCLDGPTVVISPLVALMDDQVAGLRANGIDAACLHSGQSRDRNVEEWLRLRDGSAKIVYMAPERLMTDRMMAAMEKLNPALFVVDEAHCISKWGASFRPEYEMLSALPDRFPNAVMAAFTATADAATQRDIADKLFRGRGDTVVHGFDRPNLMLAVQPKTNWRKQLGAFLADRRDQAGIVYCLSRRLTDEVAELLKNDGYRALPYHAGLPPEVRKENQEIFMSEDAVVMVATIAFGMGIDKPDIRYVFHLNLPGSMEAYYQEIGRAGRDGAPSEVAMLYGLDDIRLRRQFIEQDGEDTDHKRREHKRLDALLAYCETTQCRRVSLLSYFGEESGPCGNCDTCLDPPEVIDGTREAQMLLSAVLRTGESFGAAHIIDVLRGARTVKIEERGHDTLPTFGVGEAQSKPFWQAFIRQAIAGGYLSINIEGFGGLQLTRKGRDVLNGHEAFSYRAIPVAKEKKKAERQARRDVDMEGVDHDLLVALKSLRRELASERNVPAYVVFSDATLIDMCRLRPETLDQMALVSGVGPKKLEDFGPAFLHALAG